VTRISSKWITYYKWIFPALWFGILAVSVGTAMATAKGSEDPMTFVVPIVMAVFGFFLMKMLIWDLVDEVYDCGDALLVRRRGIEERVSLSNIINVSVSSNQNPLRITLRLDKPSRNWGTEFAFSPVYPGFRLNPFARSKVADDLIVRVDRARRSVRPD
jgi:hypothetical protein